MTRLFPRAVLCLMVLGIVQGFSFIPKVTSFQNHIVQTKITENRPQMFFNLGGGQEKPDQKKAVTTKPSKKGNRPNLGKKATEKKTVRKNAKVLSGSAWTGPAVERRAQYLKEREVRKSVAGTFSPQQKAAFDQARRDIPSNARSYWAKVAARVPGQTAESCKAMAQSVQYQKAAGDPSNFWGGYVDVKEIDAVVDENADVMKKLGGLFGRK